MPSELNVNKFQNVCCCHFCCSINPLLTLDILIKFRVQHEFDFKINWWIFSTWLNPNNFLCNFRYRCTKILTSTAVNLAIGKMCVHVYVREYLLHSFVWVCERVCVCVCVEGDIVSQVAKQIERILRMLQTINTRYILSSKNNKTILPTGRSFSPIHISVVCVFHRSSHRYTEPRSVRPCKQLLLVAGTTGWSAIT